MTRTPRLPATPVTSGPAIRERPNVVRIATHPTTSIAVRVAMNAANATPWSTGTAPSSTTARRPGFALNGAHSTITCNACHTTANFKDKIPKDCIGCHRAQDSHATRFGTDCVSCHSEVHWKPVQYDHLKSAKFALLGAHAKLDCHTCHTARGQEAETRQHVLGLSSRARPARWQTWTRLRSMPRQRNLAWRRTVRPRSHRLSAAGPARAGELRAMSRFDEFQGRFAALRGLPTKFRMYTRAASAMTAQRATRPMAGRSGSLIMRRKTGFALTGGHRKTDLQRLSPRAAEEAQIIDGLRFVPRQGRHPCGRVWPPMPTLSHHRQFRRSENQVSEHEASTQVRVDLDSLSGMRSGGCGTDWSDEIRSPHHWFRTVGRPFERALRILSRGRHLQRNTA